VESVEWRAGLRDLGPSTTVVKGLRMIERQCPRTSTKFDWYF
jgi:hypothetical protein